MVIKKKLVRTISYALVLTLITVSLSGCYISKKTFSLKECDEINIYQPLSSRMYLGGGDEVAKYVLDKINNSEFKKTEIASDFAPAYFVTLTHDEKVVLRFSVDKNNIFTFSTSNNGSLFSDLMKEQTYEIIEGEIDYNIIEKIFSGN